MSEFRRRLEQFRETEVSSLGRQSEQFGETKYP
jgi:hypothetical protein